MNRVAIAVLAGTCLLALPALAADTAMPANGVPADKVIAHCESCHGKLGNSTSGTVPRLNGQRAGYIVTRLTNFLDPAREDPHATAAMWGQVTRVDRAIFPDIAKYYASQAPTAAGAGAAGASEGRKIYMRGGYEGVPACSGCHGAQGEGSSFAPRLAGQHAAYLSEQLKRLRLAIRTGETMHPNIKGMSDAQIAAIVAYLAKD